MNRLIQYYTAEASDTEDVNQNAFQYILSFIQRNITKTYNYLTLRSYISKTVKFLNQTGELVNYLPTSILISPCCLSFY